MSNLPLSSEKKIWHRCHRESQGCKSEFNEMIPTLTLSETSLLVRVQILTTTHSHIQNIREITILY